MPERQPRTVRVDPDVWSKFVEQVVEWEGQKHGELGRHVENALEEYIDHGREARIEEKVDEILSHVSDGNGAHTHTNTRLNSTVEKAEEIFKRLDTSGVVQGEEVERVIEDVAGGDHRTLDKYKGVLKRRGLLYEHPTDTPVWTADKEEWSRWCVSMMEVDPSTHVQDLIADYDVSFDEFDQLATTVEAEM